MEPADKKPPQQKPLTQATRRKLRFDAPHSRLSKAPYYLLRKNPPRDR